MSRDPLTIFPTELAKRRTERRLVLEAGALDTSRLMTHTKLMALCERAARRTGLLSGRLPGPAERRLLLEKAAGSVRFKPGQPLAGLSTAALTGLLQQIIEQFSFFSENEATLTKWLLAHEADHKLHGLGQLLEAWSALCTKMDIAGRFAVNRALLQLIESGDLPQELDGGIHFRAVRWLNPFEERFAAALKTRLGPERVKIFSVLPAEHADDAETRLGAFVRSELMRGAEEEWTPWLEDFADAVGADDSNILESESSERVSFFTSAHPYGEIEDVARRIAREIESGMAPDEIALILRDLSAYTDIIPDVFQRFGIPYYFRRGMPAAAHPTVKALLALLAFPQNRSRDRLCDLLLMPGIDWPGLDLEARQTLVQALRKTEPPRLTRLPKELSDFFQDSVFSEQIQFIIEQHGLKLPDEVHCLIQELSEANIQSLPPERMVSLFEELLDNVTLKDAHELSTESGVWVVNPMDAAGLRFESVFIAGMDDRTFPEIPRADSLLNATERKALRAFLEERKIFCPRLALSETGAALIQEEILFLTAMSTARERLALSYTRTDAGGKERAPGEFFERMTGLTDTKEPANGESFHTILPVDACRAEDEARQTQAWLSGKSGRGFQPLASGKMPLPQSVTSIIQKWLKDYPEFSATALESLARNRYVFFLEKVLRIKPDRTHEDDTDPMDRGNLVHDILEQVYAAIADQSDLYAAPNVDTMSSSRSQQKGNAMGTSRLRWRLTQKKSEESIPLAVFDPAKSEELLALARGIAEEEFTKAERRPSRHLGRRGIWETEKRKLLQMIENFIRMDLETALNENRYPALFEMKFDAKHDLPLTLERGGEQVRLKGKIDRIDLIFNKEGELEKLLVIDYKSKSRNDSVDTLEKKIGHNLDCQLALYTFAAQQKFFGAHNTPELNEKVQAVYHLQAREIKIMTNHFSKKRLTMTPELTEAFLETLFSNVRKFTSGDLATDPLIEGYDDYSHICRTTAIEPKELLKS